MISSLKLMLGTTLGEIWDSGGVLLAGYGHRNASSTVLLQHVTSHAFTTCNKSSVHCQTLQYYN